MTERYDARRGLSGVSGVASLDAHTQPSSPTVPSRRWPDAWVPLLAMELTR